MNLVVGKTAGFCGGVTNSVVKSLDYLNEYKSIYCLGELVHNKQVVDNLESKGLIIVESLDDVPDNNQVIIRAHGVTKNVYEEALKRSLTLFDLTCPKVLKIHEMANDLVSKNYFIVLIAQKDHPEAIGTISFCGTDSFVLENEDDLDDLFKVIPENKEIAIIAQTTFSVDKFNFLSSKIKDKYKDKVVEFNTICNATSLRQKETKELANEVDYMVIIGGKNSSNTKKLFDIASSFVPTVSVLTVDELYPIVDTIKKYNKVGIMAGASTPKESISEVIDYLEKE